MLAPQISVTSYLIVISVTVWGNCESIRPLLELKVPQFTSTEKSAFALSLALQGGGSFGAFTWGVLDRLLEDERVTYDTISGASAGAVNAVLLASGLREGGRALARERLNIFWTKVGSLSSSSLLSLMAGIAGQMMRSSMSPYQFNPFDLNPLRELLIQYVDFDALKSPLAVKLLISATHVSDGEMRLFRNADLTVDHILASACLPLLHHTIMIDGEAYWDGGYVANPALVDLIDESYTSTILLVQITPMRSSQIPKTHHDIARRLDQIHFNSSLMREIEIIKMLQDKARRSFWALSAFERKLRALRLERLTAEDMMSGLDQANAGDVKLSFLTSLRDKGREVAESWLRNHLG
jgi:NTE family protein